jgi:hypothetical protein
MRRLLWKITSEARGLAFIKTGAQRLRYLSRALRVGGARGDAVFGLNGSGSAHGEAAPSDGGTGESVPGDEVVGLETGEGDPSVTSAGSRSSASGSS